MNADALLAYIFAALCGIAVLASRDTAAIAFAISAVAMAKCAER